MNSAVDGPVRMRLLKFKCVVEYSFIYSVILLAVLRAEPSDILNEYILQKFHQIQDTQGLLCYFRKHLLGDVF